MRFTRSQLASAARADEKWVENTTRTLGRRLAYTPAEARWLGLVRVLAHDLALPLPRAAELADIALEAPLDTRVLPLATSADGAATVVIDLARYHSAFAAALSAAIEHGGPLKRGRPPRKGRRSTRDAVAAAEAYGVDTSLLREALAMPPAERLARLDANAAFLGALRPVRRLTAVSPRRRTRR